MPGSGKGREAGSGRCRKAEGTGSGKGQIPGSRFTIPVFRKETMKDHKDLDVWKLAVDVVVDVYQLSKVFPREELFGLTNQVRRAAVSIPSNIAEGAARNTKKEFVQFLHVALGSASEVETQLIIAEKLGFEGNYKEPIEKVIRTKMMLNGLIRHYKDQTAGAGKR